MYSDIVVDCVRSGRVESGKELGYDSKEYDRGVRRESYEIKRDEESLKYGKPMGIYELLSIPDPITLCDGDISYIIDKLEMILGSLIGKVSKKDKVLVVGLGNRHISSDSLGAKVVGKINVTECGEHTPKVMAISPSVMGLTGIETVDIVSGVVGKTSTTHIILIDSLCASSPSRLGKSIQVSNTGICPGSGIGNTRKCLGRDIADKTLSIGVPLLIYASTFVKETLRENNIDCANLDSIMQSATKSQNSGEILELIKDIKSVCQDDVDDMIVSIKDIEECVEILSTIIACAINRVLGVDK